MKVLITGANSLLGSNLTRKLLQANYSVKALVRPNSNTLSLEGTDAEIIRGHFTNRGDLRQALTSCSAVVHVASNTAQWPSAYEHYYQTNVAGTQIMLEESKTAGIEQFIFVGSANAFGPGSKQSPGDENSAFQKVQYQSGYMRSKYEAQQLVLNFQRKHHFPATVVNPTFMLGKFDAKPSSGQLLLMAYPKSVFFSPAGGKNFVHVEDVATGILHAIIRGQAGQCYLMGNENLSYREFFESMKQVTGYPKQLIKLPKTVVTGAGNIGSIWEQLTGKPAKLNAINARLLTTDNYYTAAKAVNELQFPQTPINKAISDAVAWFNEFGYL
ncbi:NAD-dependent epimerase/dehydratase family protein [Sunxiuqinia elliptica]|uniref:NAD-dependent epimerase/dehydratase family protein n=1 Tax=Sunxiuqinia elliptica TaxID=655355 RepID=UPI001061B8C6|nr:NAD-dependent epimerase/dehydratase family protein [Sunxiuqinia elliptica]TDO62284.1 dihydroflavonol-4-reductase [Sunxiuqinia elliptica]